MLDTRILENQIHHNKYRRLDRVMLVLAALGGTPTTVKEIKAKAMEVGFKDIKNWNLSSMLTRSKGLAINLHNGWKITDAGLAHLKALGAPIGSANVHAIAQELRELLKDIKNPDTYAFVEETIKCQESGLWRSAIIVSWIGAAHVLFDHVIKKKKTKFNARARLLHANKWTDAQNLDQLGKQLAKTGMGERGFLDVLENINVITDSVKKELVQCLDRRNSCGHPTKLKLTPTAVAHHIEVLINYVFVPFTK